MKLYTCTEIIWYIYMQMVLMRSQSICVRSLQGYCLFYRFDSQRITHCHIIVILTFHRVMAIPNTLRTIQKESMNESCVLTENEHNSNAIRYVANKRINLEIIVEFNQMFRLFIFEIEFQKWASTKVLYIAYILKRIWYTIYIFHGMLAIIKHTHDSFKVSITDLVQLYLFVFM